MRVDLTPDECATIRRALSHAGSPADAIAAKLTPPERLTAVLMPKGAERDAEGRWTAEDNDGAAIRLHKYGWLPVIDRGVPVVLRPLVPTCPACGCQQFSYEEGCLQYWPHGISKPNEDVPNRGVVFLTTIGWDGIGESGDGEPGLFCDHYRYGGCGAPIDLPAGWEMEWS